MQNDRFEVIGEMALALLKVEWAHELQKRYPPGPDAPHGVYYAREVDRQRVLSTGYQAHVAKPVTPAEFAASVSSLLRGKGET